MFCWALGTVEVGRGGAARAGFGIFLRGWGLGEFVFCVGGIVGGLGGGGLVGENLAWGGFLVDGFCVVGMLGGGGLGVRFSHVAEPLHFLEGELGLFFEIFRRGGFNIFRV